MAPKKVMFGKNERMSFSKIDEVISMPNLIEVQKKSYKWFIEEGLKQVFEEMSTITDYTENLEIKFTTEYRLDDTPKYNVIECKARDATYSVPLRVKVRLLNKETGEIKENEVYLGEIPLMTESGTFVINGAERAVVSQLVRSPNCYFEFDDTVRPPRMVLRSTIIPNRGAWIECEADATEPIDKEPVYVKIDKNRRFPLSTFLRALGYFSGVAEEERGKITEGSQNEFLWATGTFVPFSLEKNADIDNIIGIDERMGATFEKDTTENSSDAIVEVYKKLRPGEPATVEGSATYLRQLLFDPHRYEISRVGRYKYNKKLSLSDRIAGRVLAADAVSAITGEVLASKGEKIDRAKARELQAKGVCEAYILLEEHNNREFKVISNSMVDISGFVSKKVYDKVKDVICENVSIPVLKEILESSDDEKALIKNITENADFLIPKHITVYDILASVNYFLGLPMGVGKDDDIDHLGNRRIRSVGELLQNQFRIGFARMERSIREKLSLMSNDPDSITPLTLINARPVGAAIKEFFGSSPLSQFMDQTNPLSELTHKRRLSALGPGGLSRDRASFEVRDVHYTHYGRMCPIETPEGPNIGLISYLATFAKINDYGFIEAPFRRIDKKTGKVLEEVVYMTADEEDDYIVAQANEPLDEEGKFKNKRVNARYLDRFMEVPAEKADFMDVSPKMVVSVATAMIPFLENDDTNRALMGSNMQKQAVPLLKTENPIVGTGMEYKAAVDSGVVVLAKEAGEVVHVSADTISVKEKGGEIRDYNLIKFLRSNHGTCINQRPIVAKGEKVEKGQVIADGPATANGEISLGKNALIGFMTWEGYNYEDAVLINQRLVRDDVYTSIHIEEHDIEARDTKLGAEEITRDIPNVGEDALKDLDERGIIRIGAEVRSGDILVGKVTPKGETELTAEERLLRAIFADKAREVRDTSLRVPHGEYGTVVDVKIFTRENSSELSPGVNMTVRVYVAQKRKISVGDKMAGRHGNKGVVSRILPSEDMPFLKDGTPLDIVLNPLGVPSRMNIGQVLEVHLGYAAKALGWKVCTPVFDGAHEKDIIDCFEKAEKINGEYVDHIEGEHKIDRSKIDGKFTLYDGRTGEKFDNPVTVGYMYYLKLHHLVDDKIHARSTGPYSLVTQQPLGGKAQFGGQRFGEMEVWALEAYGAAYTLQEILTVKSDDIVGRVKTYEAIVKGQNVPESGVPESFKVLIKELQSLALDVQVLDAAGEQVDMKQTYEDDDIDFNKVNNKKTVFEEKTVADNLDGYGLQDENGEDIIEETEEVFDEYDLEGQEE